MSQSPVKYQKLIFSTQTAPMMKRADQTPRGSDTLEYYSIFFIIRLSKILLIASTALLLTLVIFNHLILYTIYFEFMQNVLSMKAVFLENIHSWRAITSPLWHYLLYGIVVIWQIIATILCWWGVYQCGRTCTQKAERFHHAKFFAIAGLTLAFLLWMTEFVIGREWFLMWQSELWNGEDEAIRMMIIIGLVLIFTSLPDSQP
jgi:predicted small integral membrane protein